MWVVITEHGAKIKKKRRRILIEHLDGRREEYTTKEVDGVYIMARTSVSTEILKFCAKSGIPVVLATTYAKPIAILVSSRVSGTVKNRREQYKSVEDWRGTEIAKNVLRAKILNQASNLKYYAKARRRSEELSRELYESGESLKKMCSKLDEIEGKIEKCRTRVLAIEGEAAQVYWENMAKLTRPEWGFEGRNQEGKDVVNRALNIAYSLLSSQIWKNCLHFSLDPFQGYVHSERPGKISLVFDLMEPFRPLIDRFVFSFLPRYWKLEDHNFSKTLVRKFFDELLEKRFEYGGRNIRLRYILFLQVQNLVSFLNRKGSFRPFRLKW